jgi:hypothetical protein
MGGRAWRTVKQTWSARGRDVATFGKCAALCYILPSILKIPYPWTSP